MADPAYIDADGVLTDGEAWVPIAHASLSLPASQVTWTSTNDGQTGDFSQYMDLVVVSYVRSTATSYNDDYLGLRINGISDINTYNIQEFRGTGASIVASQWTNQYILAGRVPDGNAAAKTFGASVCTLSDINSGKYKVGLAQFAGDRDGAGTAGMAATTAKITAPIASIYLYFVSSGNLAAGSKFSLFGVLPRMVA